jgi:hypothetical protein
MVRLRLLPGERELVRLRPSPGAFLPRYLGGVGLALWGLMLAFSPGTSEGGAGMEPWVVFVVAFAGPALVGAALYLPRRRMVRFVLCVAGGTLAVAIPVACDGDATGLAWQQLLWMTFLAEGIVAAALAETDRRMRRYHLTNLRILHLGGLWDRRGWTLHYDTILDLDVRQTPLARLLGHGTIDPVLAAEKPAPLAKPTKRRKVAVPAMKDPVLPSVPARMWGVRPLDRVRKLVEAFVTDATATDYLRSEQQTQKRVGQAMHDLGRANLIR